MLLISQSTTSRLPNDGLKALAIEIYRVSPTPLIAASKPLAKDAELAVKLGSSYDAGRTQEVLVSTKDVDLTGIRK